MPSILTFFWKEKSYLWLICCFTFGNMMPPAAKAQKRWDTWYFPVHFGVKINQCGPATPLQDIMIGEGAGTCTISDTAGNVLFCSNGNAVWNKNGQMMPNGDLTRTWSGGEYYYQGPIFVPHPANDSIYYLFHVKRTNVFAYGDFETEFDYNIVNKNLDNGKGDLVVKERKLYGLSTEATAAVQHQNKTDYWVVSHKTGSDSFVVFKVTAAGLDTIPKYYKVGPTIGQGWRDRQLVIKFSPNLRKMVISRNVPDPDPNHDRNGGFDLYDFDPATGVISNPVIIRKGFVTEVPNSAGRYFSTGAEFSPDSKLLYISTWDRLYQFDITVHDSATINNSRYLVSPTDIYSYGFGHIQMGSDGRIYVAKYYSNGYLALIDKPNVKGVGCNYSLNAIQFPNVNYTTYRIPLYGLGNCIQPYLRKKGYDSSDMVVSSACTKELIHFSINNVEADSIKWNFGDAASGNNNQVISISPDHYFASAGMYRVSAIIYSACSKDTIAKSLNLVDNQFSLGTDASICSGDTIVLLAPAGATTYQWSNNAVTNSVKVFSTGSYWVRVNRAGCIRADTINVTVKPLPSLDLGTDRSICQDSTMLLDATDSQIQSYTWSTGATTGSIAITTAGQYWVQVSGINGCTKADTIQITTTILPLFSLGADTTLCEGQFVQYQINEPNVTINWQDGSTANNYLVKTAGMYQVTLNKSGCIKRDTVSINYKALPVVLLGSDTTLCDGSMLLLDVNNGVAAYKWQDGSQNPVYIVNHAGLYNVQVTKDGCYKADSILVSYKSKPKPYIGKDTLACTDAVFSINAFWSDAAYLWTDGSTGPTHQAIQPGTYEVKVSNSCGDTTMRKVVAWETCETAFHYPNVFSPNGDGINDEWVVQLSGKYRNYEMQIFDRWGRSLFQTTSALHWNGIYNGKNVGMGTYYFVVRYFDIARNQWQVHKGFVQILL